MDMSLLLEMAIYSLKYLNLLLTCDCNKRAHLALSSKPVSSNLSRALKGSSRRLTWSTWRHFAGTTLIIWYRLNNFQTCKDAFSKRNSRLSVEYLHVNYLILHITCFLYWIIFVYYDWIGQCMNVYCSWNLLTYIFCLMICWRYWKSA